jgi:ADP-ribose pyrophosphatase
MLKTLEKISSESKYVNPFWEYKVDKYRMPTGRIADYHYVNSRGATIIIPITENKKYLMVNQYRYLNQRISLEFPGGGIKDNMIPLDNAVKELVEETGFKADSMRLIGEYNPFNGVTNEICNVYIAEGLMRIDSLNGDASTMLSFTSHDESEEFKLVELTKEEINDRIRSGEIWDGMTLAAWGIYLVNNEY